MTKLTEAYISTTYPGNEFSALTTDLEHWAGYGVTTEEGLDRYMLEAELWDGYKDVHGIRPRFLNIGEMTDDEIRLQLSILDGVVAAQAEEERVANMTWQEAMVEFHKKQDLANPTIGDLIADLQKTT